jgi:hypothetical protein
MTNEVEKRDKLASGKSNRGIDQGGQQRRSWDEFSIGQVADLGRTEQGLDYKAALGPGSEVCVAGEERAAT